ncbi:MAG: type II toxin-antitoxin system VapC family toxin [Thermoguttaceae bacterium]
MIFADIPSGAAVFIDANSIIYHFVSEPTYGAASTKLLERLESNEIEGWLTPHILAEASHRLMTIEACSLFGWPYQGIAARLQKHPQHLAKLTRFRQALGDINRLGLQVISVATSHVLQAAEISQQHGLLTNDAISIAVMQSQGLTNLASNDSDFDRIVGISRFAPV